MQLVLATLNFPPAKGGVEQLCSELALALHALGVEVHVIAPGMVGDAAFDMTLPYRVTRFAQGKARHVNLARALDAKLREGHSRVLFGQWTAAGMSVAQELLRRRGVRFATLGHAKEFLPVEHGLRGSPLFAGYRRAVLKHMQPVLCVSKYTAAAARAAGAHEVHVLHPGVDSARFSLEGPAAPARVGNLPRPLLLTVARLVSRKGIDTVITALPELLRAQPRLTYGIVGEGPDRGRLHALAVQHGVAERVVFLGAVDQAELPALYRAADLFVLASRQESQFGDVEGFGLVLLEAQACGTPVVAADSGGMPDAFLPNETGFLVPPASPSALASALGQALHDRERLAAMGEAARRHALGCSWSAVAERAAMLLQG